VNAVLLAAIASAIEREAGGRFVPAQALGVAGGSIHASFVLYDANRRFFVKTNSVAAAPNFAAEADGLALIASTKTVRVPAVVCHGTARDAAFLVLEFLPLIPGKVANQAMLGRGLASLHRATAARFGLDRNNFIGSTPQENGWRADWVGFFRERRLRRQLELAARNGFGETLETPGNALLERMSGLFPGYSPRPSLLHGDLWPGNAGFLPDGTPVVYDPAVYYGDREADLAMTELFGGFASAFYAAYDEAWPRDPGYAARRTLYNLYHVLNHLNLFGAGYLAQAQQMIAKLKSELC
jgi:protein-ribulosamine 3-kinase